MEDIIFKILTLLLAGTNVTSFVYMRSIKQKYQAEADSTKDCVLYKRIEFLDQRVTKLENSACFKKDCKDRIK